MYVHPEDPNVIREAHAVLIAINEARAGNAPALPVPEVPGDPTTMDALTKRVAELESRLEAEAKTEGAEEAE